MLRRFPFVAIRALAGVALLSVAGRRVVAQTSRPLTIETDLDKDPSGTPLLHLARGTAVTAGAARGTWTQATVDGWIVQTALHDDKRDGFDVSVSLTAGTTLRERPGAGAVLATARLGALFDRVEIKSGWVHVRRTGWISSTALVTPKPATPAPAAPPPPPAAAAPSRATTSIISGTAISASPGNAPVATIEAPLPADVIEHKGGWAHVRIDAWVHDASLGNAPAPNTITAAEIRAAPDKYVGQTVEWTVQILGIEKADELRPELPAGAPYLLARGPLPETGFLYIGITNEEADSFRHLEPLAKVRIRATIRAGRSRFLPTPVLSLIRRLD
ncbi:MAG TPA: hypothetical protein VGL65_01225 [Gemmatimonadales bacterium]|jgi:hypothetical protein